MDIALYPEVISETLTAELYDTGTLQLSNTDSELLGEVTGAADKAAARDALVKMLGEVGKTLSIQVEGVDF